MTAQKRHWIPLFSALALVLTATPGFSQTDEPEELRLRERHPRKERVQRVKRTPKALKAAIALVKAKKPLSGSRDLFDFIESDTHPEYTARAEYWLGKALQDMGLIHSAQYHYQRVVKTGPGSGTYFGRSLAQMVHISEQTKDPIHLVKTISRIEPADYPATVQDDLYYYAGIDAFDHREFNAARRAFSRLGESNPHYIQARYYLGVIHNIKTERTEAFEVFKDIYLGDFRAAPETRASIKRLSMLNMARLYYASERFDQAARLYERVPRLSAQYPTALQEAAWAYYMSPGMANRALGHTTTLSSPFFENDWLPEVPLIEALTYFAICEYDQVGARLDAIKAEYAPIQEEIQELLPVDSQDFRAAGVLYKRLYSQDPVRDGLPEALFATLEANLRFAAPHNRVQQIQRELAIARSKRRGWSRKAVGKAVIANLLKEQRIYMKLAGIQLTNGLARMGDQITEILNQGELLRFEVLNGLMVDADRNSRNPPLQIDSDVERDWATNPDQIYWPFNGEFWEDELGYIVLDETGACRE
jgi:tetratricopeptide (TPR) repeat protein